MGTIFVRILAVNMKGKNTAMARHGVGNHRLLNPVCQEAGNTG